NTVVSSGNRSINPRLISWEGETLRTFSFGNHHSFQRYDETSTLHLEPASTCETGPKTSPVVIRDLESEDVIWRWNICDHFTPPRYFQDWDHNNAAERFVGEDAILLSPRNLSAIMRVNVETDEIEWMLGYGGVPDDGWNGDFAMDEEDRFVQQHAPEIMEDGHILMFDNAYCEVCLTSETRAQYTAESSRAIEIAYDTEDWSAEVVYEFVPDPPILAPVMGDADRLSNGNTVSTFGRQGVSSSHIIESNPAGEAVWELSIVEKSIYRSERIDPYFGHVVNDD
ncbi:MAG: aryl-sulfate sulfotransferase, partial [Myxococcales bacterium]|nr:aryl-sulfate sulfotransferase [Myxococcales bacterium]